MNGLSASVTRILSLSGFPRELKTRDIQAAFSEWENDHGGFKIKWLDDTSLLIVFNDAVVEAKRAYLSTLLSPPPQLSSPTSDYNAVIRPYDGPDAQNVISIVNQRSAQGGHRSRSSVSGVPSHHNRGGSRAAIFPQGQPNMQPYYSTTYDMTVPHNGSNSGETSPTLPTMPEHPTLNSLISSTLTEISPTIPESTSPRLAASDSTESVMFMMHAPVSAPAPAPAPSPPKIGNPGKRMLGAALGIRHPALGARVITPQPPNDIEKLGKAMNGLSVSE